MATWIELTDAQTSQSLLVDMDKVVYVEWHKLHPRLDVPCSRLACVPVEGHSQENLWVVQDPTTIQLRIVSAMRGK